MTKLITAFRKIMLSLFILLLGLGVLLGTLGNMQHKSYLAALLMGILLLAGVFFLRKRLNIFLEQLNKQEPIKPAAVLTVVCLLVNGIWVLCFHPEQAPDYRTFFQAAMDLSNGLHPQLRDYLALFPHILGYSAFLSLFLKFFGQSLMTAAILNVFLTTVSGLLIFILCCRWRDTASATLAFAFWTVCPSKLLYNAMSLSEPYYTCLLLLFFLIVSGQERTKERKPITTAIAGVCAGAILGLVNTSRPIGIIPVIALAIWLLFLCDWKEELQNRWRKWLLFFAFLLAAYVLIGSWWENYAAAQLEQKPASIPGYSIYVGFNPDTQGSYSDQDMELLQSRYFGEYERNADAAQKSMLEDAMIRVRNETKQLPSLLLHKLGTLLGHDEGGAYYSKDSLSGAAYSLLCMISNLWYYIICILAVTGCIRLWQGREDRSVLTVPLFSVGLVLAQLLVEVAARYHYSLLPMLIILASFSPKTPGYDERMEYGQ